MKNKIIHPEQQQELSYWAGKWGISVRQLQLAIIDTGQVDTACLKDHLQREGILFSFTRRKYNSSPQGMNRGFFSSVPFFNSLSSFITGRKKGWHSFLSTNISKTTHENPIRLRNCNPADHDAFLQG